MNACLPLMKNVFTPQAKRVYVPLGLTEAASTTDAAIQNNILDLEIVKPMVQEPQHY